MQFTDRKILPYEPKVYQQTSVANDMQFTDRKTLPYEPKAKFTDRYSAGILDNPQVRGTPSKNSPLSLIYACLISCL